jgi:hypothetical protein
MGFSRWKVRYCPSPAKSQAPIALLLYKAFLEATPEQRLPTMSRDYLQGPPRRDWVAAVAISREIAQGQKQ